MAKRKMSKYYDIIIVGGGPSGIFAALELVKENNCNILLVEKGRDIEGRHCPAHHTESACRACSPCHLVCGLGGAGAYSDGKLTLSGEVGGRLPDYLGMKDTLALIGQVDDTYLSFGAPTELFGTGPKVTEWQRKASLAGLKLTGVPIRHMGTERSRAVLGAMRDYLTEGLELKLETTVSSVVTDGGAVKGIVTESGEQYTCRYLVLAPGREGSDWLSRETGRLGLTMHQNPVDVGVRVEVASAVMAELTNDLYEAKLEFLPRNFHDHIRTFCMCPGGEVIMESTGGADPVITVNGHSYANRQSENTNFALLVSTSFTMPFHEPIAYGKYLARLANLLSGGILVQRLGDLRDGHRSTPARIEQGKVQPTLKCATPGDLSFALPYRHLSGLLEMLGAMERLVPAVAADDTLLYGLEVKFYSSRPELSPNLETEVKNLFAVGDGAGVSRGLIQASASGVVAAREIKRRLKVPVPG
ncbi:MAG: NAD(P)-binding protein [Chloroflexota bacterium]